MTRHSYRERDYALWRAMLTLRTGVGLTRAGLAPSVDLIGFLFSGEYPRGAVPIVGKPLKLRSRASGRQRSASGQAHRRPARSCDSRGEDLAPCVSKACIIPRSPLSERTRGTHGRNAPRPTLRRRLPQLA